MKRIYFLAGTLAVGLLCACQPHDHKDGHAEEAAHEDKHGDEIVLPEAKARAAGVKTDTAKVGVFSQVIKTGGRIQAAQGEESTVVAPVSGVVSFVRPLATGLAVSRGAALVRLSSDHIQDGDPAARARIAYLAAQREYERAKPLADKKIVTQRELSALKSAYDEARLAYEALVPQHGKGGTAVAAGMAGYVKNVWVGEGDYVEKGAPLLVLTRNRRLRLQADVSARHYAALPQVISARFRLPYGDTVYDLAELDGRMVSYGRASGEAEPYIPVLFDFDNSGDVIPGSYAEVWLLGEVRDGVLTLPLSALAEAQGTHFVYVRADKDCYHRREVRLGADDGRHVEILSGVKSGEVVVTEGVGQVRLAAASGVIPAHTHSH